jgi:outer membrane receptor protein involved in Fe transport
VTDLKRVTAILISSLLAVLFAAAASHAQTNELFGNVRDQNGGAIAGALVTVSIGGTEKNARTDDAGAFRFTGLTSLTGRIRFAASGFTVVENEITGPEMNVVLSVSSIVDTITVTLAETRLNDTPQSVIVIAGEELRTDPAPTVDDKLRQVPGFTLFRRSGSRTANPTSQGVSLRGTGGSGASRAAVTVDGFPLNDPFGGWVYWGRVAAQSIRSVEVLRGSAGEVYGSSAIGGVISLNTYRPVDAPIFSLDASYGSQHTGLTSLFSSLKHGRFGASIAAEGFRTDGFITVADDERGIVDTAAGVSRAGAAPFVEFAFTKNTRAFLSGEYFQERRKNGTPLQTNDTKIISPRAGLDITGQRLGDLKLRGWFLSQRYHQSFSSIAADRNSETITRLQTVPSRAFGASLLWTRTILSKGSVFAGTEYRNASGSSDETAFVAGRPTSLVNAGGREATFGAFAGGSFLLHDRFVISGGVRVDRWKEYSAYSDTRPISGAVVTRITFADRDQSAISPRLSALFRVNRPLSLTASVSRGFRQPTLNELYRSFRVGNVLTLANENLRAERSTTFEGGMLASPFGQRVYLRAVVFCVNVDQPVANVTLTVTPSLITRQRQNLGSTRSCGLEADSNFHITRKLNISAGYLFADSRVRSFPADTALERLRVPQVPRQQFTFQARYDNPKILTASLQLRAASAQFDDDQNLFRLRPFAVVDLFVSRRLTKNFEIYFAAENIFDSTVEAGRTPVLTITNPRTARAGIRLRFGRR